ncbi:hypothetical protein COBT_004263, partial [Conglomerata obtusa]
ILNAIRQKTSEHLLISLSYDIDIKPVVSEIIQTTPEDTLIIAQNIDMSNTKICHPTSALQQIICKKPLNVIISDVYPCDIHYGYIVEILLQELKECVTIFFILHAFDFTNISRWVKNAEIINVEPEYNFDVLGFANSKNDF